MRNFLTGLALVLMAGGAQAQGVVTAGPYPLPSTDASGTIATGGTFQTITAANPQRKSFEFVNICAVASACTTTANVCYLYLAASGTPTTNNSIAVPAGASYLRSTGTIPTDAIQATCTGTGDHFRLAVQ